MSRHSEGEWENHKGQIRSSNGKHICLVHKHTREYGAYCPTQEANGRLIEAAPELLKFVKGYMETTRQTHSHSYGEQVRTLLDKIEGK